MERTPYMAVPPEALILRDKLAIDRTLLANERTLLAYLRSALSLVIVGITFIHFFEIGVLLYIGLVSIPSGLAVAAVGIMRYRSMDRSIRSARESSNRTTKPNHETEQ
jgi:putative membrane protein